MIPVVTLTVHSNVTPPNGLALLSPTTSVMVPVSAPPPIENETGPIVVGVPVNEPVSLPIVVLPEPKRVADAVLVSPIKAITAAKKHTRITFFRIELLAVIASRDYSVTCLSAPADVRQSNRT